MTSFSPGEINHEEMQPANNEKRELTLGGWNRSTKLRKDQNDRRK